jgi:hypothetical protein
VQPSAVQATSLCARSHVVDAKAFFQYLNVLLCATAFSSDEMNNFKETTVFIYLL